MNSPLPAAVPDLTALHSHAPASTAERRQRALAAANALLPGIRSRATRTEAERRVPQETIDELREAGLFDIATPRRFGGGELGFRALVEITEALASACGSTGWVYGVLCGPAWMASLFPA